MPLPDYQHPLAQLVDQLLRHRKGGGYDLDDQAAEKLEAAILSRAEDPGLKGALLALFGVAEALHHQHGSMDAAANLLAVLGRVGRKLSALFGTNGELGDLLERVASTRRDLAHATGQSEATPRLNDPAPKGAISVNTLADVQRARMGLRPSRGAPRGGST